MIGVLYTLYPSDVMVTCTLALPTGAASDDFSAAGFPRVRRFHASLDVGAARPETGRLTEVIFDAGAELLGFTAFPV